METDDIYSGDFVNKIIREINYLGETRGIFFGKKLKAFALKSIVGV